MPGTTPSQRACDIAIMGFDRAAYEADQKWGMDRLPSLVPPATAARYARAYELLMRAFQNEDIDGIKAHAQNCIKGIAAMNRMAEEAGLKPMPPKVLEAEIDGLKIAVVEDPADMRFYNRSPDVVVYTLAEIQVAIKALAAQGSAIDHVKRHFPEANVTAIRPQKLPEKFWEDGGDAINLEGGA